MWKLVRYAVCMPLALVLGRIEVGRLHKFTLVLLWNSKPIHASFFLFFSLNISHSKEVTIIEPA